MPKSSPSDEHKPLIKKLSHACASYDSAAKKYLHAVKALDTSLEALAIAIRELSQGEENEGALISADRFCMSVDRHMANASVDALSGHSKSRRCSDSTPCNDANYPFAAYMSDFTREVSSAIDDLKNTLKSVEKSRSKQDDLVSKYNKKRSDVDALEMKLAKKNKGITTNEKFSSKLAERDALRVKVDAGERHFISEYAGLLQKRTETLLRVVHGIQTCSAKYYAQLSRTLQS